METDFGRRMVRFFVGGWTLRKKDFYGKKITPFCCQNCGYIELYREMKETQSVKP